VGEPSDGIEVLLSVLTLREVAFLDRANGENGLPRKRSGCYRSGFLNTPGAASSTRTIGRNLNSTEAAQRAIRSIRRRGTSMLIRR
jgi:hypothetical protein